MITVATMVQEELTIVWKGNITGQAYENKFSDIARNVKSAYYKSRADREVFWSL